jgi:hypothetical protein
VHAPPVAQDREQLRGEHHVAILVPLPIIDAQDHPLAIDGGDREPHGFRDPEAGGVAGRQDRAKIQRRLVEDVAFRVLAAGNAPDFRTIADFRKTHLIALRGFFEQVLRLARELGAPRVGRVALDGSKVKANASKHKAMSYGRMREKQQQLREEVTQLLAQAEAADAAEDAEYGAGRRGDELPAELQRRESRLKRIREAKRALEARAKDEATAAGEPAESAKPESKAQYNFTDPESRIMKSPDGFVQAYNVQVAVDELQLIVGHAVTQETNDKKQLLPMITTIEHQSGDTPTQVLADAGYCSDANLAAIADTNIDAYISTRKQKHGERPRPCPRGPLPTTATIIDRMSRKLHTKAGAEVYAARKGIVEPVIGQIKHARGFRQFLLRGFEKVQGEWSFVCTTHNILKLYRLCG